MISQIWRVNLATMLYFTFIQLVVPLIPRYALTIGATPFLIGLAVSSISVTAILIRPISGVVSDRWSRSWMMVLGIAFGACGYAILALSEGIYFVMAARLLEGVGVALFVPSSMASAVDSAPEGKVGETLGWRSLMIGLGFMVGPALGGFLAEAFGYKSTFALTVVLIVALLPLVIFKEKGRTIERKGFFMDGIKERGFLLSFSSLLVYAISWMGLLTFLSAYLKAIGYGDLEIGLFVSVQALSSLALRVIAGRVADRLPEAMTYLGLMVVSASFFMIYLNPLPPFLYGASVIFGIGIGVFIPGSQTLALRKAPPYSRGFLSSIYTMGIDVGNLIGPLLFGTIIQATGSYESSFAVAPILTMAAALVVFIPSILRGRSNDAKG
ncbi:MAG: MFS transporter [Candidatus Methanomethylicia archaeon]|nr:MFS transporter [Candidatus Methanomethylicia archaeon]